MTEYAAFISYSTRYADWVAVLQRNLEACLDHLGADLKQVFRDETDIAPGQSWISQIEEGLVRSDQMILILTPEALVSGRVENEWQVFIDRHRDWARTGKILPVQLVWAPPLVKVNTVKRLDFTDPAKYKEQMQRLVGALLALKPRDRPELPKLEIPAHPTSALPKGFRKAFIEWMAPFLKSRPVRKGLLAALNLKPVNLLESYPTPELAASALWVHSTGSDDELSATKRLIETLIEELRDEKPDEIDKLRQLAKRLEEPPEPRPRESLLRRYLDQVARDHDQPISGFHQRAELDLLDRVYVRLELRADLQRLSKQDEPRLVDAQMGIRQLLALDPEEHDWVTRRWVIRGDPGAGKTTLLRHLAASLARNPASPWVPIFESLPRLLRDREPLLDRLLRKMQAVGPADGLLSVLEHEAQQGNLLLLLDGLDEVPDRDEAARLLRDFSAQWPQATIVVTTRPIGYRRPSSGFSEVDVLPLDEDRQQTFLARWFGRHTETDDETKAQSALKILQSENSLRELAGNPLYLTLMALLIERNVALSRRRDRLYDQVFRLLLDCEHRPDGKPIENQSTAREALRFLAYGMTEDNLDASPVVKLEERLYRPEADFFREILERVPRWRRGMRPFLDELAQRTGILGPHDGPDADWRYWHRTFREALASEELAERYKNPDGKAEILEHAKSIEGNESRWAEPYALLTGRLDRPDDLVKALVKENRALGLRAIATAQNLADTTLAEVLELSDEWEERIKVYAQLPELVDDPERLLPLLDRLRQRTRNGNDLFHLDLAFAEAAKKWPDAAIRAETCRSRLFEHIPAPEEDLFRWIETPYQGRVELWQEIPAGSFLMGSPDDEDGRYQHEGPQQPTKIEASFALAACPVTNAQFAAFDSDKVPRPWQSVTDNELPFHPAVDVTWFEASMFCRWLAQAFPWPKGARLPSEEEWEYACRAGTTTRYFSGDGEKDLDRVGWYDDNSGHQTHRVGEKEPNPLGLFDIHGNVWEWTVSAPTDDFGEVRSIDPQTVVTVDPRSNPAALAASPSAPRVIRGGSFLSRAWDARSAYRSWFEPGLEGLSLGFRVLLPFPRARDL